MPSVLTLLIITPPSQVGDSNLIIPRVFHVGGTGPDNYTCIQYALGDADFGDVIFVHAGVYNETILINKTIMLIGEDKNTTIIKSNESTTISILSEDVTIKGFTIKNECNWGCAVEVRGSGNQIVGNIVEDSCYGVNVFGRTNDISGNIFKHNRFAITLHGTFNTVMLNRFHDNVNAITIYSSYNGIVRNMIRKGHLAISIFCGDYNYICNNEILYQIEGILIERSIGNRIFGNVVGGCERGIYITVGWKNLIMRNDFLGNNANAFFYRGFNIWLRNYWGKSCPVFLIPGIRDFHGRLTRSFALDIFPAKRPINIVGVIYAG